MKDKIRIRLKEAIGEELRSIQRKFEWFARNEMLLEAMPELPKLPESTQIYCLVGDIYLYLPRIQSLIRQIKELPWGDSWKLTETDSSKADGNYTLSFKFENSSDRVIFYFQVSRDGATCELVRVGEETKTTTVPIYEVTCKEGAEEFQWEGKNETI